MTIPIPSPIQVESFSEPEYDSNFKLAHSLLAHTRAVTALRFSTDGTLLVSAGLFLLLRF